MERVELNCVEHGTYHKFITDSEKNCPYCEQVKSKQSEINAVNELKMDMGAVVQVKVACQLHGEQTIEIPKGLISKLQACPKCIKDERTAGISEHIKEHVRAISIKSGLPLNSLGMQFAKVDRKKSEKQTKIIERLVKYICDVIESGDSTSAKNILLCGNMGTGKTLFASILLQNITIHLLNKVIQDKEDIGLQNHLTFAFLTEQKLHNSITATWGSGAQEKTSHLYSRLSKKAFLCIDDVGSITSTNTHLLDAYSAILDERYKRNLPTIITTNMNHEGLKHAVGVRAADRFLEKNRIIVMNFDWSGYREAEQGTDEIEFF